MRRCRRKGHRRGTVTAAAELGQVGGLEAIVLGMLVLVMGTLVVASAWGVIDAKIAVDQAAQDASRAFVLAPSSTSAITAARAAAFGEIAASGREPKRASVSLAGALVRCASVVATVSYRVPLLAVPLLGASGGSVEVSASHGELVPPFRSAASGTALACG